MARYVLMKETQVDKTIQSGYKALYFNENGVLSSKEVDTETEIQATLPYTEYVALLTQSGTSAPTATVVNNTLSGTPTFQYVGVGEYRINLTGEFTTDTVCMLGSLPEGYFTGTIERVNNDSAVIKIRDYSADSPINGKLNNTSIQIKIYE